MKLSISNIGWDSLYDVEMYNFLHENGFLGIEIAPTRIFPNNPYDCLKEAAAFSKNIIDEYNLSVSSIQSIWFGKTENIFADWNQYNLLIEYTKKAIDFAYVLDCKNIVFGCPKNRNMDNNGKIETAYSFFAEIAKYAASKNTVIALEPNPTIYGTNFINSTSEAFDFAKQINEKGFAVNVDLGTIIENSEYLTVVQSNIELVNHIHISEPYLDIINKRNLHNELANLLKETGYNKFVSIEMKNSEIEIVKKAILYIKEVFCEL